MLHLTTLVRLQGVEWICETSKVCAVSGMFWRNAILAMLERGRIALWGSIYLTYGFPLKILLAFKACKLKFLFK